MNGHYNHNLSHQRQQQGGRQLQQQEWESSVNGRSKSRISSTVPALPQATNDGRRERKSSRHVDCTNSTLQQKQHASHHVDSQLHKIQHNKLQHYTSINQHTHNSDAMDKYAQHNRSLLPTKTATLKNSSSSRHHAYVHQSGSRTVVPMSSQSRISGQDLLVKPKVVNYQSASGCLVSASGSHDSAVYGLYSETKYTFAVNGMPGNPAQASAAAAFFAR